MVSTALIWYFTAHGIKTPFAIDVSYHHGGYKMGWVGRVSPSGHCCTNRTWPRLGHAVSKCSPFLLARHQGLTGRLFQLRVGSGLGIGKNYRVGSGLGSGSGIGNIYWINRVLSGIENLDRVFPYFVIFNSWSTWLDIKFGISYRAYYLFTICIHNKSKTIAGSKFSAPNNIKIVFKSQWQKNRDKSA